MFSLPRYLPAQWEKKLFRYILTHLDFLEAGTLADLENLEGSIGYSNLGSTLRNVNIKVDRLKQYLPTPLPPRLHLTSAVIGTLTVRIPTNVLLSGSVEVEIRDVRLCARVLPPSPPPEPPLSRWHSGDVEKGVDSAGGDRDGSTSTTATATATAAATMATTNTDTTDTATATEAPLPTAEDLARSFLHSQPLTEQEMLLKSFYRPPPPASPSATSSSPAPADSDSDSDSDDDPRAVGVGTPVGLPRILANMFKGIADRLVMRIHGVTLTLDAPASASASAAAAAALGSDEEEEEEEGRVLLELMVSEVDFAAAAAAVGGTEGGAGREGEGAQKRCVTVRGIAAYVVAAAAMFEGVARGGGEEELEELELEQEEGGLFGGESECTERVAESVATLRNVNTADMPMTAPTAAPTTAAATPTATPTPTHTPTPTETPANTNAYDDEERFADFEDSDEEVLAFAPSLGRSGGGGGRFGSGRFGAGRVRYHDYNYDDEDEDEDDDEDEDQDEGGAAFTLSRTQSPSVGTAAAAFPPPPPSPSPPPPPAPATVVVVEAVATSPPSASPPQPAAQKPAAPAQLHPGPYSDSESGDDMDADASRMLSESMLFTHSEAGSLYLSATSGVLQSGARDPEQDRRRDEVDEELVGDEEMDMRLDALLGVERGRLGGRRVRRRVAGVDVIRVLVPALLGGAVVERREEDRREEERGDREQVVPGAFSMYASRTSEGRVGARRATMVRVVDVKEERPVDPVAAAQVDVEVVVGSVDAQVDFATARVLGVLLDAVTSAMNDVPTPRRKPAAADVSAAAAAPGLGVEVLVGSVALKLIERLAGVFLGGSSLDVQEEEEQTDGPVIVECALRQIKIHHTTLAPGVTSTKVAIKTFTLGDGIEDIISFLPAPPPPPPPPPQSRKRNSHPPPLPPVQENDVTFVLSQSAVKRRVNVATLPLKVNVNLARLEATLGAFGGVGGVLASTSTTASTVTLTKPPPTGRRVEVDSGGGAGPGAPEGDTKVACSVAGVTIEIVGVTGKIGVETSPVRIRSESKGGAGVVVALDRIGVYAPDLPWDVPGGQVATSVLVEGTRVEFLGAPADEDLARLLELLTPSKDKFADDDDILIDTLLRQRQQGSALRVGVAAVKVLAEDLGVVARLRAVGEEVVKVLTVTDFVAQDERPGLLTLLRVGEFAAAVDAGGGVGRIDVLVRDVGVAHVSLPSLVAVALGRVQLRRNGAEELVGEVLEGGGWDKADEGKHMLMLRVVGDEPEPVVKLKLWNVRVEYRVDTLMALTSTPPEKVTAEVLANEMVQSVISVVEKGTREEGPPLGVDVLIRDCVLGLNPLGLKSRGLVVLTDSRLQAALPSRGLLSAGVEVRKAFVMLIDDTANLLPPSEPRRRRPKVNRHHDGLSALGYVSVVEVSSARVTLQIVDSGDGGEKAIDLEVHDDLLLMESCADSTQTLLAIVNGLKPPLVEDESVKYCTQVMEVDMFRSLTENAFTLPAAGSTHPDDEDEGDLIGDDVPTNLAFVESYYGGSQKKSKKVDAYTRDQLADSMLDEDLGSLAPGPRRPLGVGEKGAFATFTEQVGMCDTDPLAYVDDHFGKTHIRRTAAVAAGKKPRPPPPVGQTVATWDSVGNRYVATTHSPHRAYFPLRVKVRDVHLIWNLHDGYDWPRTRDTISAAVKRVEYKAAQRRDRRVSFDVDEDEESEIGDFLFNSIYIGIPAKSEPGGLTKALAKELDDHGSETSYSPSSTANESSSRPSSRSRNADFGRAAKNLRLSRSKTHKLQFELKGVCVDFLLFPPEAGETQSSVDVRVRDLEIIDNVPTSTWKKFVTYMQDAGGRETGSNMVHLEVMNVRPVPELAASELVLKVTILPLRLHVDQDTLDFMTRFFEFKDTPATPTDPTFTPSPAADIPFLQRVEVNSVRIKLDYKPKKVDYASLRSGRTTEFMNFFILEEADMVLRHCVLYGISGFPRMSQVLNDTWMPDVKNTQLGYVLAGVAPVRSLANLGGGLKDLVAVPMREYKKDGRIVRAVQKGAIRFAKTTTSELVRLGAKVAVGTQNVLQGAEDLLVPAQEYHHHHHHYGHGHSDADSEYVASMSDSDDDIVLTGGGGGGAGGDAGGAGVPEKKVISLYADQPMTVVQGLRGAGDSLRRNFGSARDAIMDVPRDIAERGSAQGAAVAVARAAPVAIIRPMIGATEAVSRTLLGVTNALDPEHKRRVDDKYKKH